MKSWDGAGAHSQFQSCSRLAISSFIRKIFAVKFAVKLRSRRETLTISSFWFPVLGEGIPQIVDMYFQVALTSEHVAGFS